MRSIFKRDQSVAPAPVVQEVQTESFQEFLEQKAPLFKQIQDADIVLDLDKFSHQIKYSSIEFYHFTECWQVIAFTGNSAGLKKITSEENLLNLMDKTGKSVLFYAAWGGNTALMEEYIEAMQEKNPTQAAIYIQRALFYAGRSGNIAAIDLLCSRYGAQLEAQEESTGNNILHCIAESGSAETLQSMIKRVLPAQQKAQNLEDDTVLHKAVESNSVDLVKLCLSTPDLASTKTIRNTAGQTPSELAAFINPKIQGLFKESSRMKQVMSWSLPKVPTQLVSVSVN